MSEEISWLQKIGPWLLSIVFGVGSGVGAGRFVFKNHGHRIKSLEGTRHKEMLTIPVHNLMCDKNKAQMINTIGDMIETRVGKVESRIMKRLDEFDRKREQARIHAG